MIIIGGSAGSLDVIIGILQGLPGNFQIPVVLVIHRLRNTASKLDKMLSKKTGGKLITEPEDKEPVKNGRIYLAPQNYHLLIETDHSFSLDYSHPINYSRPSIDVSMENFADVYGRKLVAILLSGANKDGAAGLQHITTKGGMAIIQDPVTAAYPVMPKAAIELAPLAVVLQPDQIVNCILDNT